MRDDQVAGPSRPVVALAGALGAGVGFGAVTSMANGLSHDFADLESTSYTLSGWSFPEVFSVVLDSGWAWAGLAVLVGWLVARPGRPRRSAGRSPAAGPTGWGSAAGPVGWSAMAGALALLAATAAYAFADTVRNGGSLSSFYESEPLVWWVTSVLLGAPLGAVGAYVHRSGALGLLARLTVPIGAAVQMLVLPPGRNETITAIGQTVVGITAIAAIVLIIARFLAPRRPRPAPPDTQAN